MKKRQVLQSTVMVFLLLGGASLIGMLFRYWNWSETTIVLVYILSVLVISRFTKGYVYGIVSSVIATFLFNYFFTAPYYTLLFYDSQYFMTFIVMTVTSIVMSASTSRIQTSQRQAKENAQNMKNLYELTNHLSEITDPHKLGEEVTHILADYFKCLIGCIFLTEDLSDSLWITSENTDCFDIQMKEDMQNMFVDFADKGKKSLLKDGYEYFPLYGASQLLGFLFLPQEQTEMMSETQKHVFDLMLDNIALALDRVYSIGEQLKLKETTVKEHYRSNLLRSISHDLRTPLSGIMGTAEMLMGIHDKESQSYHLAQDVYQEANWLYLMVQNILSLTKVQEGKLVIHKEQEAIEEIIGSAVSHVLKHDVKRHIDVYVPQEVMMVPMDAQLILQVLINLLDNAFKHTSLEEKISVYAYVQDSYAYLIVEDEGEGFSNHDPQELFEMFYTQHASYSDSFKGVGLGLTICKAIVEAHGGTIEAQNCQNHQGAKFIVRLPMEEEK